MSYCPLCVPEFGITDDDYVIIRFYPESEMNMDTMQTRTYELEDGIHIIREGWFKELPQTEEYEVTWEICHPLKDWHNKHMLNQEMIQKESELINKTLNNL